MGTCRSVDVRSIDLSSDGLDVFCVERNRRPDRSGHGAQPLTHIPAIHNGQRNEVSDEQLQQALARACTQQLQEALAAREQRQPEPQQALTPQMQLRKQCLETITQKDYAGVLTWFRQFRHQDLDIRADREIVLEVVRKNGWALGEAHLDFRDDKEVVSAAVETTGGALELVNTHAEMWKDKDFVLRMIQVKGDVLSHASNELRGDKDMLFKAFQKCGVGVAPNMEKKAMVLIAVQKDGMLFGCAPDDLRSDKEVATQAVTKSGCALKFAKPPLNVDQDLVKLAGLGDCETGPSLAILSVKYGMTAESTNYSNEFVLSMRHQCYLKQFNAYNPSVRSKANCDDKQDITSPCNQCRGTLKSCKFAVSTNLTRDATSGKDKPGENSCWRFAFRFRQEECKDSCGFMIQVEEIEGLGQGQIVESMMAEQVGLKVFRTFTNKKSADSGDLDRLEQAVKAWIEGGYTNMDLEDVWIGVGLEPPPSLLEQRRTL